MIGIDSAVFVDKNVENQALISNKCGMTMQASFNKFLEYTKIVITAIGAAA